MDPAGQPGQRVAPRAGDAPCHGAAALPGEGKGCEVAWGCAAGGHRPGCSEAAVSRRQLAFEALRDGFVGDMALDDVTLTAGACGAELSCSFEAGACGLAGSGQWWWQSGGTGITIGPVADHTTGDTTGTGAGARGCSGLLSALPMWLQLSAHGPSHMGAAHADQCPWESQAWGSHSRGLLYRQDIIWW